MTDMRAELGAPPPRRWRIWHFILIGLGALALLGAVLYFVLSAVLTPIVASGDDFLTAMRDGDFERAYSLTTPALQQQLGDARRMGETAGAYRPQSWSWSQRRMRNGIGMLEGEATYQSGRTGTVRLVLHKVGDQWRIDGFNLN